jgi:hypothetical protein
LEIVIGGISFGNEDKIRYCINVILKEAKLEDRLVKQTFYTMLSAYTTNPLNLAINSPSGEGKNYVLRKVAENFPKEDIMFLAGMTDKALFHRAGKLVIMNSNGEYEEIEEKIKEFDARIEDIEAEIATTNSKITREGLKAKITAIQEEKKELYKDAKKLIDLSHKILIFLDTPSFGLFNALMPLLSHDNYEVEYEYADTTNTGIRTRTNILRGYPAVIFAQALDFSHNRRYPEIQRRFIITNPKMDKEKYKEAIKLIGKKFGLPDLLYQNQVVNDLEKENVREIIRLLRQQILDISDAIESGRNNVIIPYEAVIIESLQSNKAQDMTVAYRLFSYLALLPVVNIDKRPSIRLTHRHWKRQENTTQVIPLATYDDLAEAMFLMQYANGVRPYILEWYYTVFLKTFNTKTGPESKVFGSGEERCEDRKAVTTEELVIATKEVQNKNFTNKKILESFLEPLMNEGYIDKHESSINHRNNIYYPTILVDGSEKSSFDVFLDQKSNDEQQISRIKINDFTLNPTGEYIKDKVGEVISCSSTTDVFCELLDHNKNRISVDELVKKYYANPTISFHFKEKLDVDTDTATDPHSQPLPITNTLYAYTINKKIRQCRGEMDLHLQDHLLKPTVPPDKDTNNNNTVTTTSKTKTNTNNPSNIQISDEQHTESKSNSFCQTEANDIRLVEKRILEHYEQDQAKDTENKTIIENPTSVKEVNIRTTPFLGNLLKEYENLDQKQRQSTYNTNNDSEM